jgi:hypothetical protein
MHVYEVRLRKDHRGVDLISDALPFGGLWYAEPNAIGYAKVFSRSHRSGSCEPSLATLVAQFAPQRSDAERTQTKQGKRRACIRNTAHIDIIEPIKTSCIFE